MVMDKNYFECLQDSTKPVSKSIYYTHQLHLILCELPKFWASFVFSYTEQNKKSTEETYNKYVKLYSEFTKKAKED